MLNNGVRWPSVLVEEPLTFVAKGKPSVPLLIAEVTVPNRWVTVLDPSLKKTKGKWTKEEDALILAGVAKHGRCWMTIREALPGRLGTAIQKRYEILVAGEEMKWNRWLEEEDNLLRDAIEKHGTRDMGLWRRR